MYCKRCGNELSGVGRFCPRCGLAVSVTQEYADAEQVGPLGGHRTAVTSGSQGMGTQQGKPPKRKKRRLGVILSLSTVAVAVAAIAVAVFIVLPGTGSGDGGDFSDYEEISSELAQIKQEYADENGFVDSLDVQELMDKVEDHIQGDDRVVFYDRVGECLTMELSSGILYAFVAPVEGAASGGVNCSITTLEPWWEDGVGDLAWYGGEVEGWGTASALDEWSYWITEQLNGYSFSEADALDDAEVTLDVFKNFKSNQIVVYYGHGSYCKNHGSFLSTGVEATKENRDNYSDDLKAKRIEIAGDGTSDRLAVGAGFFDKYYSDGSLSGSHFFLLSCHSLQSKEGSDPLLAKAFVDKGAITVTGADDTVKSSYLMYFFYSMIGVKDCQGLTDLDSSGRYLNFSEALENARKYSQENYLDKNPEIESLAEMICYPTDVSKTARLSADVSGKDSNQESGDEASYESYISALEKVRESGSWREEADIDVDMSMEGDGSSAKTSATLTMTADVSNYDASAPEDVRISGDVNVNATNQTTAFSYEYADGTAHYSYTSPSTQSADVEISPEAFMYAQLSDDAITDSSIDGGVISFTVSGQYLTEQGISALGNLFNGAAIDVSYGDARVKATIDPSSGKLSDVSMVFDAAMSYQGYDIEASYDVDYSFSDASL